MLQSIRDPRLDAAKNSIMLSDAHKENLAAPMPHLAQALDMIKTTTVSTRNISTTQSYGGRGGGRGDRGGRGGRGRGNARGGRHGRRRGRSRGRGGGGGGGGREASAFDPNNPGRSYSPPEWRSLIIEEQARCRAARAETAAAGGARPRTAGALGTPPVAGAPVPAPSGGPGIRRDRVRNG